jgi:hypothetical protein
MALAKFMITFSDDKPERYETDAATTAANLAHVFQATGWVEAHRLKASGPGMWTADENTTVIMASFVKHISLVG